MYFVLYCQICCCFFFFFSSRRRHTRYIGDWSSDVCSSDLDFPSVVIKDTSLLAAVAGGEIVSRSQNFAGTLSISGYPVEWLFAIWTAVAISYFAATFTVTRLLLVLERRFHTPGLEAVSI